MGRPWWGNDPWPGRPKPPRVISIQFLGLMLSYVRFIIFIINRSEQQELKWLLKCTRHTLYIKIAIYEALKCKVRESKAVMRILLLVASGDRWGANLLC